MIHILLNFIIMLYITEIRKKIKFLIVLRLTQVDWFKKFKHKD